jgi:nitroimidazol reductase NimA-like FMN-containing flavoprotein (pyridoxamine 5'-phosphate oxidase superfamily)
MSSYGLDIMDRDECQQLLRTQRVGRVAVGTDHPAVLPVVYGVLDGDVVFRTAPGEKLIAAALHRTTAFEIDAYDGDEQTGWSVNVVGPAEELLNPADLARARALDLPAWAGEVRDRFIRIRTEHITGRRIVGTL